MASVIGGRCSYFSALVRVLEGIAPSRTAAKWDNVGVLVDSTAAFESGAHREAYRVLLTNDLTPAVLEEAVREAVNAIVTYHPTPFVGLKKFSLDSHAARVVLTCAHRGIGVYSPHTAWDCVPGGINDWLVDGIAAQVLADQAGTAGLAADAARAVARVPVKPAEREDDAARGFGDGRIATWAGIAPLADGVPLNKMVLAVKRHLQLAHVQVALPWRASAAVASGEAEGTLAAAESIKIQSFAVCAGSGTSVLAGVPADLYITGEMSHHDVLAATAAGRAVILTHHSNCERGYLHVAAARLQQEWAATFAGSDAGALASIPLAVRISHCDADPLVIV